MIGVSVRRHNHGNGHRRVPPRIEPMPIPDDGGVVVVVAAAGAVFVVVDFSLPVRIDDDVSVS